MTATGASALGNSGSGVRVGYFEAVGVPIDNAVGGTASGAGNVIAYNGGDGVAVESGSGTIVSSNSIYSNTRLGIDLGADELTANDAGDVDTGANNLQNFPVLTSATGGSTTVEGDLDSTTSTTFRLEFFSNDGCDPSGYGEGKTYLGFKNVTTDGSGNVSFSASLATTVAAGDQITVTATDPDNNTSELSPCLAVSAATPVPGLTIWGLAGMAAMLAAASLWRLRRTAARPRTA